MQQLKEIFAAPLTNGIITPENILDVVIALSIAFVLTLLVAKVYMLDQKKNGYDKSFIQSLVLIGVVVAMVIMVVGNNIAGAFGLVGAVSIIRFRTRLSSAKDTAYVFLSIAIGLASGLHQYIVGVTASLIISAILLLFWKTDFGEKHNTNPVRILSIKVNDIVVGKKVAERVLLQYADSWNIRSVNAIDDKRAIVDYQITLNEHVNCEELFQRILENSEGQYAILRFDILHS